MKRASRGAKLFAVIVVSGFICLLTLGLQALLCWILGRPLEAWDGNDMIWIGVVLGLVGAFSEAVD